MMIENLLIKILVLNLSNMMAKKSHMDADFYINKMGEISIILFLGEVGLFFRFVSLRILILKGPVVKMII